VRYDKPPLIFQKQADQFLDRGLRADRDVLIARLKAVSYYRLSGYWFPFRKSNPDQSFKSGTSLDTIWKRYTFDRHLRLLVMDAIERVEVSVRTSLVYHFAHTHGPFGYTDPAAVHGIYGEMAGVCHLEQREDEYTKTGRDN